MPDQLDALEQARQTVGLTMGELWLRYFELGGMSSLLELDAILHGALHATPHDHDLLAVAINERSAELGGHQTVPYSAA